MSHSSSKKYMIKGEDTNVYSRKYYRSCDNDLFKNVNSLKFDLQNNFKGYSKYLNKNFKLPKVKSKQGKTIKKVVVAGFGLAILGFTIGFPVTICLCLLSLFLLLYK